MREKGFKTPMNADITPMSAETSWGGIACVP
jgi:hypothetical protein